MGRPDPLVVVLDEFQYLGDDASGAVEVASELNAVWEARQAERPFAQAYVWRSGALGLPMVAEWGRWEGADRDRRSLEIDVVARLAGGGSSTTTDSSSTCPLRYDLQLHL